MITSEQFEKLKELMKKVRNITHCDISFNFNYTVDAYDDIYTCSRIELNFINYEKYNNRTICSGIDCAIGFLENFIIKANSKPSEIMKSHFNLTQDQIDKL